MNGEKGFLGLLGIIFSLLIIGILYHILMKTYFKKPEITDKAVTIEDMVTVPNIDSSNPRRTEQSVRQTIENIQNQQKSQLDEFMQQHQ